MKPLHTVWQVREELVERRAMTRSMRLVFEEKTLGSAAMLTAMRDEEEFCTRLIAGIDLAAGHELEPEAQARLESATGGATRAFEQRMDSNG